MDRVGGASFGNMYVCAVRQFMKGTDRKHKELRGLRSRKTRHSVVSAIAFEHMRRIYLQRIYAQSPYGDCGSFMAAEVKTNFVTRYLNTHKKKNSEGESITLNVYYVYTDQR